VSQTDGVHRASTTVIETDDPDPSAPGSPVTVRYAVLSDSTIIDCRAPTGQVAVTGGGAASCTGGLVVSSVGTVTVGRGSCTLTLGTAGQVTLPATYSGNETFFGSSDSEAHLAQQRASRNGASKAPMVTARAYIAASRMVLNEGQVPAISANLLEFTEEPP
jgi:hypothetical protein